jgi:hypothetical protein
VGVNGEVADGFDQFEDLAADNANDANRQTNLKTWLPNFQDFVEAQALQFRRLVSDSRPFLLMRG